MKHTDEDLKILMTMVKRGALKYIDDRGVIKALSIAGIILYGGAARYHFDISSKFNDYDLNVFFKRTKTYKPGVGRKVNRRGKALNIGSHNGKKVEILFNVLSNQETPVDFIRTRAIKGSKRWKEISTKPLLFLYPERKDISAVTA